MSDIRARLERAFPRPRVDQTAYEAFLVARERKERRSRVAAASVGLTLTLLVAFGAVVAARDDDARRPNARTSDEPTSLRIVEKVQLSPDPLTGLAGIDDGVTAGSIGGDVVQYSSASSSISWRASTPDAVAGSPILVRDTVVVGSLDGTLSAFDFKSGDLRWSTVVGKGLQSPPAFWQGELVAGTDDGTVVALRSETGEELWSMDVEDAVFSTPFVDEAGVAYVSTGGGHVYAMDAATGVTNWSGEVGGAVARSQPALSDKLVLVGSSAGLYALSTDDGAVVWKNEGVGAIQNASPLVAGDQVVVSSRSGQLSSVNLSDGRTTWFANLHGEGQYAAYVAGDVVYVTSQALVGGEGSIEAYGTSDGTRTAIVQLPVASAPQPCLDGLCVAGTDGMVYVVSASP